MFRPSVLLLATHADISKKSKRQLYPKQWREFVSRN